MLDQPKNNETILHCGHIGDGDDAHFFKFEKTTFVRSDNTTGTAQWLVVCKNCFVKALGDPKKIKIGGDCQFRGDEPIWSNKNVC